MLKIHKRPKDDVDDVIGVIVSVENGSKMKTRALTGDSTLKELRDKFEKLQDCTFYDEDNCEMSNDENIKYVGTLTDTGYWVINAKQNKKKLSGGDVTLNQLPKDVKKGLVSSLELLRGVRIKNGKLLPADYSLFKLKNNITWDNHCRKQLRDSTVITKTMNSSETTMARSGYSNQEIRAEISGYGQSVGGGVAVNNSDSKEQESFQKNEMFVANYMYSRGVIVINEQCVDLSGDFLADVDKVIHQKMTVQDLEKKYGSFYQSNVSVGASIYCTEKVYEKQDQSSSKQEDKLKVDFEVSVSYFGVSGKASDSSETGLNTKQGNKQLSSSSSKTLKRFGDKSHYNTWSVINVNEIKSIYNLLPKDKKSQMLQIKKKIKEQSDKRTYPIIKEITETKTDIPDYKIKLVNSKRYASDAGSKAKSDVFFYEPHFGSVNEEQKQYCIGIIAARYDQLDLKILVIEDPNEKYVKRPTHCIKIWTDKGGKGSSNYQLWRPVAPNGFVSLSDIPNFGTKRDNNSSHWQAGVSKIYCVSKELVQKDWGATDWVWNDKGTKAKQDGSIWRASTGFMVASRNHNKPSGKVWKIK